MFHGMFSWKVSKLEIDSKIDLYPEPEKAARTDPYRAGEAMNPKDKELTILREREDWAVACVSLFN